MAHLAHVRIGEETQWASRLDNEADYNAACLLPAPLVLAADQSKQDTWHMYALHGTATNRIGTRQHQRLVHIAQLIDSASDPSQRNLKIEEHLTNYRRGTQRTTTAQSYVTTAG